MASGAVEYEEVRKGVTLSLNDFEAETLRAILFVTQCSLKGRGAAVSSISRALDEVGLDPCETGLEDDILDGKLIRQSSVDTGIYWV